MAPVRTGDPGWIRTTDLPLRRRPLYPLSYEASPDMRAGPVRLVAQKAASCNGLGERKGQ